MAGHFSQVATPLQWASCALRGVEVRGDVVELAWRGTEAEVDGATATPARGLAFDRGCRLFRQRPGATDLERALWEEGPGTASALFPFHTSAAPGEGESDPDPLPLAPGGVLGLAADAGDRLFATEVGATSVQVFDLWSRSLLRRVSLAPDRPTDLASSCDEVYAALANTPALARFSARGPLIHLAFPAGVGPASRVALAPGGALAVLTDADTASARLTVLRHGADALGRRLDTLLAGPAGDVPWAGDLAFEDDDTVVVARTPGADFLRLGINGDAFEPGRPLRARSYTGGGIARAPDGRIAYWGSLGPRAASDAPVLHAASGTALTGRLDSGTFQGRWGRLFLDAAVPKGGRVRIRCFVSDDIDADADFDDGAPFLPLHCRGNGREVPFTSTAFDLPYRTLEAPVVAGAGRYLHVELLLEGNTRVSPRIRALRAEHADHGYLQRLPRAFSRDAEAASFLRRYLGPLGGFLRDVDERSQARHQLLVPETAPAEMLPWLAGFLGLALDDRWPDHTRRALIDEANELFRRRGTLGSLKRFLELYVCAPVRFVEHFRLRGLGGGFLSREGQASTTAVLGGGFRVGGSIGTPGRSATEGAVEAAVGGGAGDEYAHRFTVLVGRGLDEEELRVVRRILDVHRPAHTVCDVCTVGAGMRVGRGLHAGFSSFVGPTGGWMTSQVGDIVLGRENVLGRPQPRPSGPGKPARGEGDGPC